MSNFAIVLHGGAGVISQSLALEERNKYTQSLAEALEIGVKILKQGGLAVDCVVQTFSPLPPSLYLFVSLSSFSFYQPKPTQKNPKGIGGPLFGR
jgi:hypothetical protein